MKPLISVEVAYALPDQQIVLALQVVAGSTVGMAIEASGLLRLFPALDLAQVRVGCFGKPCGLDTALQAFDRVEIYRPLQADPKEVRRRRAALAGQRRGSK